MPKSLFYLFSLLFLTSMGTTQAQSYRWAAGLKLSKHMGISAVYSPKQQYSVEGIISKNLWTNEGGLSLIGRYHRKIISRGLNFYGGGGLHYGFYDDVELNDFGGVILQGGAEISLGKTNLSFNLTPMVGIGSENVKLRIGSDFTLRYILKKQPRDRGKFFQKLGFGKDKNKGNKKKRGKKQNNRSTGKFWDFDWLKGSD
ncbi:hypothetical protein KUV50_12265 [Membranicola marinus]|uniref:DUF3575 domain-containing protein n=1 Tax=Membranihabitans marinus TaxID=1227546 RepID=A0A953LBV8_9BACT|nr:hypothetical protein [Membranihabitans marinus]MBY5958916.1 hypothetical protein [Membranihabitans marinus]